jgi:hypothetical protein
MGDIATQRSEFFEELDDGLNTTPDSIPGGIMRDS